MKNIDHLAIYFSNRCNLSCRYCYVAVNQGKPVRLRFDQLTKSFDYFMDQPSSGNKRVSFLGGEPFLQFPILSKIIEYIHQSNPSVSVSVFTNGTLLTKEKLSSLEENGAFLILSLDGNKRTNDLNRKYSRSSKSVFEDVMKKVRGLSKKRMGVNMVFTPKTISSLVENIDLFYHHGFRHISFYPDLYGTWSNDDLGMARQELKKFEEYYTALFSSESLEPFTVSALAPILERNALNRQGTLWWQNCHNLVLGGEGSFHLCDKAMSFPPETVESVIGNPQAGIDWKLRNSSHEQAREYIQEHQTTPHNYSFCPMGIYFYSRWSQREPESMVSNFDSIDSLFSSTFLSVAQKLRNNSEFKKLYPTAS